MRRRVSLRIWPTAFTCRSVPGLSHLHDGCPHFAHEAAEVDQGTVGALRCLFPRGGTVTGGVGRGPALGGQAEHPAPFRLVGGHQSLVLHHLEGGIDRARAGPPDAATPLGELGDDLVAVHRLLGEQRDDGGPHVAPSHLGAPSEHRAAESGPEATVTPESGPVAVGTPPSSPTAAVPAPVGPAEPVTLTAAGSGSEAGAEAWPEPGLAVLQLLKSPVSMHQNSFSLVCISAIFRRPRWVAACRPVGLRLADPLHVEVLSRTLSYSYDISQ